MHGRVVIAIALVVSACGAWAPGVAGAAPSAGAPTCAGADRVPADAASAASVARVRSAIACLLDAARAERDLPALHRDARLASAAGRFAAALDINKPLTHTGRGGTTPIDRIAAAGYGGGTFTAAEALGRARGALATPAARVRIWLESKSIKKLLLSKTYRDVGVGVSVRGGMTTYVVELARSARASSKRASASSSRSPKSSRS
ncbi:CAP domain-containing protein [Conexibacter woesei]|uniref:CAP domain-containing protein n=1 Tax=Conexibacter woesei TaxID=191495 RepID=UPI0018C8F427|nr:CAP domain-containing protein [Conexibacter woesei]